MRRVTARTRAYAARHEHYRTHRNRVGEQMVRALLRAQATIDAAQTTNDIMPRMNLIDLEVSVEEVQEMAEIVLRAELVAILSQNAYLHATGKREIADRYVARLLPRRDGPHSLQRRMPTVLARHEDPQAAMRREIATGPIR